MDLKEILQAWKNVALKPDQIVQISKERLVICNECEHKTLLLGVNVCGICHCPILGKTHSPMNTCPKQKWKR
jgi:hypothetical protein